LFKKKLLPEQPINKEEIELLVDHDWLEKSNRAQAAESSSSSLEATDAKIA
jgi:hypothetical protein